MRRLAMLLACAALVLPARPALADFTSKDARQVCSQTAKRQFRADSINNHSTDRNAPNDFTVEGVARRSGKNNVSYVCRVRNGTIYRMVGTPIVRPDSGNSGGHDHKDDKDDGDGISAGTAVGVAAAALLLGTIANRGAGGTQEKGYAPSPGVNCFPEKGACYDTGGGYRHDLSTREFGGGGSILRVSGASALNVRSGPSTANPVLFTVGGGIALRNRGCRSGWCEVQTTDGRRTGWASASYLR